MARPLNIPAGEKTIAYRYEALSAQGKLVKGTIRVANEARVQHHLAEKNLRAVSVEVVPPRLSLEQLFPTLFAIKPREVVVFSRQLATLLESGLTLLPALELIHGQAAGSKAFGRVLSVINDDLRIGNSFAQAVSKHPKVFSDIYRRTLAVGERTGRLETVLRQLANYQEKQGQLAQKAGKALTYPAVIMSVGVVVVFILMTVALPPLVDLFGTMNVNLPLPTRILIAVSNFITAFKVHLLILAIVLGAFAVWYLRQPSGRRMLDRLRLTLPLIGPPTLMAELGRFSRTMSVLVSAGVPLQEIMELVPQTTGNSVIRNALNQVRQELFLGHGLSGPMSHIAIFPPLLIQMVNVGEESNTLDTTMGVVADFYETTSEEKMSALVGLITPLSTIVIALFVGFIAMAIIVPMYSITGAF